MVGLDNCLNKAIKEFTKANQEEEKEEINENTMKEGGGGGNALFLTDRSVTYLGIVNSGAISYYKSARIIVEF